MGNPFDTVATLGLTPEQTAAANEEATKKLSGLTPPQPPALPVPDAIKKKLDDIRMGRTSLEEMAAAATARLPQLRSSTPAEIAAEQEPQIDQQRVAEKIAGVNDPKRGLNYKGTGAFTMPDRSESDIDTTNRGIAAENAFTMPGADQVEVAGGTATINPELGKPSAVNNLASVPVGLVDFTVATADAATGGLFKDSELAKKYVYDPIEEQQAYHRAHYKRDTHLDRLSIQLGEGVGGLIPAIVTYKSLGTVLRMQLSPANALKYAHVSDFVLGGTAVNAAKAAGATMEDGQLIRHGLKALEDTASLALMEKVAGAGGVVKGSFAMGGLSAVEAKIAGQSNTEALDAAAVGAATNVVLVAGHKLGLVGTSRAEKAATDAIMNGLRNARLKISDMDALLNERANPQAKSEDPNAPIEYALNGKYREAVQEMRDIWAEEARVFQDSAKEKGQLGEDFNWLSDISLPNVSEWDAARRLTASRRMQLSAQEEMLEAWKRGEVDYTELENDPMLATALKTGEVRIDEREGTYEIDRTIPNTSNIVWSHKGVFDRTTGEKMPERPILGSAENPATPEKRGADAIIKNLRDAIGPELSKQEVDAFEAYLRMWDSIDREYISDLGLEVSTTEDRRTARYNLLIQEGYSETEARKIAAETSESRASGLYFPTLHVIDLFLPHQRGMADHTLAHELGHGLTHWIPKRFTDAITTEYKAKKAVYLARFTPEQQKWLQDYWDYKPRSPEAAIMGFYPDHDTAYRFANPLEFWAETVRDRYRLDFELKKTSRELLTEDELNAHGPQFDFDLAVVLMRNKVNKFLDGLTRNAIESGIPLPYAGRAATAAYDRMLKGQHRTSTEGFSKYIQDYFNPSLGKPFVDGPPSDAKVPYDSSASWRSHAYGIAGSPSPLMHLADVQREREQPLEYEVGQDVHNKKKDEKFGTITGSFMAGKERVYKVEAVGPDGVTKARNYYTAEELSKIDGTLNKPRKVKNTPASGIDDNLADRLAVAFLAIEEGKPFSLEMIDSLGPTHLLATDEAKWMMNVVAEKMTGLMTKARGGKQTYEGMQAEAASKKTGLDSTQKLGKDTANLAVRVTRERMKLLYSVIRMSSLKARTLADDANEADFMAYNSWIKVHADMQRNLEGSISNIARALGSLNIDIMAKDIMNASTIEDLTKVMNKRKGNKYVAAWAEMFKGWIFSNPSTHITNTAGMLAVQMGNSVEDYLQVGYGRLLNSKDRMELIEANGKVATRVTGIAEAARYTIDMLLGAGGEHFKKDEAGNETGEIDLSIASFRKAEDRVNDTSIARYVGSKYNEDTRSATALSLYGPETENTGTLMKMVRRVTDYMGVASRAALQGLGVEDNFFRSIAYRAAIKGIAIQEGLKLHRGNPEKLREFVHNFYRAHTMELESNLKVPTQAERDFMAQYVGDGQFHKKAYRQAAVDIFGQDFDTKSNLDDTLNKLQTLVNKSAYSPYAQFLIPTFKTPINILRYIGQRTPLLFLASETMMRDFKTGGRQRDLALAKLTYGSLLYMLGGYLYAHGFSMPAIDKDMRKNLTDSGIQEDSLIVKGHSHNTGNLDPIGSFLGLSARLYYMAENVNGKGQDWDYNQAASYGILAFSSLYSNRTFNKSLHDFLQATFGDQGAAGMSRYINNTATSWVTPFSGMLSYMNSDDPFMREAETALEAWERKVDPAGFNLRLKLDNYGKPIPKHDKLMGFTRTTEINNSPIRTLMLALQIPMNPINDREWRGVKLDSDQGHRLQEIVAELGMEESLNDLIQTPEFKMLPDAPGSLTPGTKGFVLRQVVSGYRRGAMGVLLQDDPTIVQQFTDKLSNIPIAAWNEGDTMGWGRLIQNIQRH